MASSRSVCLHGFTQCKKSPIVRVERRRSGRSCLLLLAGGAAESVRDSLASVAETLLGALEHAATLVLGLVAA
jgi:hypothetical protein